MLGLVKTKPGVGALVLMERTEPRARAGYLVVEVCAAGICGTDLHIERGEYTCCPPVILGHEIAGVVVDTCDDAANWKGHASSPKHTSPPAKSVITAAREGPTSATNGNPSAPMWMVGLPLICFFLLRISTAFRIGSMNMLLHLQSLWPVSAIACSILLRYRLVSGCWLLDPGRWDY